MCQGALCPKAPFANFHPFPLDPIMSKPFAELCQKITSRMSELQVPGVAVGAWFQGHAETAAFGITSTTNPLPVTPETLFQVGSISKTMLATAAMRLVEQGLLELDRPVRSYLPHLRLADEATAAQLTLRHLLTHTGGWAGDYFNDFGPGETALEKMVESLARLPQLTPVGSLWHYNNAGFAIAGRVLEVVTGQSFETVCQNQLFVPLGMHHSFFFPEEVLIHRFVVGHFPDAQRHPVPTPPWAVGRANHPAGGVVANIPDLLCYARFHLSDGLAESGERLLQPASLAEMRRPQAWPGVSADAMGLTWFIKDFNGMTVYRHGGATHGQNAQFLFVPQHNFAFAILSNAETGDGLCMEMYRAALQLYLNAVEPAPTPFLRPEGELLEYAGLYEAQAQNIQLVPTGGELQVTIHNKGGFPTPETPPGPNPEPYTTAFYAPDHTLVTAGPQQGTRAEFIRNAQGQIEWLRTGGRIHRKR